MENIGSSINYKEILKKHDPIWDTCPKSWYDAAIIGNGLMGATIYSPEDSKLCWCVSRTDVTDRREGVIPLYGKRRLPIGELVLNTVGRIIKTEIRQKLYDAEIVGNVTTDMGSICFKSLTHNDDICIFIDMHTAGGENGAFFSFKERSPASSEDKRVYFENPEDFDRCEANAHPIAVSELRGDLHIVRQELIGGSSYATVWREKYTSLNDRYIFLSIGNGDDAVSGCEEAVSHVLKASEADVDKWLLSHRQAWHDFYKKSYISIPNKRLEGFYWIQLYKLNSATRADRPAVDLLGPWYLDSPWQIIWWNLNVELTYWPVYASNHLELGESLCKLLDDNSDNLSLNVPEEYRYDSAAIGRTTSFDCLNDDLVGFELCDLPFACHNYWLQCMYSMDMDRMKNKFYPLLKRAMALYLHLIEMDENGVYHIPEALSPEYPITARDTNCDIAFLRWGLSLLLDLSDKFCPEEPMKDRWRDVLSNLADYQIDEYGLMIGRDVSFDRTHRHYSHLFAMYPLYLINWDQEENRDLMVKSVERWLSFDEKLQGYSYTGAASIYASMREGKTAEEYLEKLLDAKIYPNTLYAEKGPCIETPLSAAKSLQDMLLQSWGGKIRVFPAIPDNWSEVSIHSMRVEGAFLVSAVRRNRCTSFVYIKSLEGGICEIENSFGSEAFYEAVSCQVKSISDSLITVDFDKSGQILIWSGKEVPDTSIPEVLSLDNKYNYYGSGAIMPIRK